MSDSVRPHRWQPTRLPRPCDSPDKNTGVGCHFLLQCMKVRSQSEVTQSCPTLSDPMDCSLQAPPSMGFSRQEYWSGVPLPLCLNFGMCVCAQLLSPVRFFVVPWTVAYQASLSMEFARQEYWCGLLFPPPGNFPDPGIKPTFPASQADSLVLSHKGSPSKQ